MLELILKALIVGVMIFFGSFYVFTVTMAVLMGLVLMGFYHAIKKLSEVCHV